MALEHIKELMKSGDVKVVAGELLKRLSASASSRQSEFIKDML